MRRNRNHDEIYAPLDSEAKQTARYGPDGDFALSKKKAAAVWKRFRENAPDLIAHRDAYERRLLDDLPLGLWDWYVRRCARLSTRLHDMSLRAHVRPGILLRSTQFAILAIVRNTRSGETLRELARRAGVHRTTLCHSLARLERLGLVRRERVRSDRRRRPVSLTDAGELAIRLNASRMHHTQLEIGPFVKDGLDGIDRMRDGLKRHFFAVRRALYHHDLHPEMYDDTPRGQPWYWADSTVAAQRRW